jgi:hypothetical protein
VNWIRPLLSSSVAAIAVAATGCLSDPWGDVGEAPAVDASASDPPGSGVYESSEPLAIPPAPQTGPPIPPDGTPWVVNMTPVEASGEINQDYEAFLAVNPSNPDELVATAATPSLSPWTSSGAPVYVSFNGGKDWTLSDAIPHTTMNGDITVAFRPNGASGSELCAATIAPDGPLAPPKVIGYRLQKLLLNTTMSKVYSSGSGDQPFLSVSDDGRWLVANNHSNSPAGAAVDRDRVSTGQWETAALDSAAMGFGSSPSVRVAISSNGKAYAAFFRSFAFSGTTGNQPNAKLVVKRDDDLKDDVVFESLVANDGTHEAKVADVNLQDGSLLGQQRVDSVLALAVHPGDSSKVWLACSDGDQSTLHVWVSETSGVDWKEIRQIDHAANPALAIAADGTVGFLYQSVEDVTSAGDMIPTPSWVTHFERTVGSTTTDAKLAVAPADFPVCLLQPYIGDYVCLLARGNYFHGAFCASNGGEFPFGVRLQRNHDEVTGELLDSNGALLHHTSIDPYYFCALTHAPGGPQ